MLSAWPRVLTAPPLNLPEAPSQTETGLPPACVRPLPDRVASWLSLSAPAADALHGLFPVWNALPRTPAGPDVLPHLL